MRRRRPLSRLLLVVPLLVAGCATAVPRPQAPAADAQRALALLDTRWREFSDLRTLADVELVEGGARRQLTAVLLARAPDSVRFEGLSPLGPPLFVAVIDQGRLTTYDVASNQATVAPATAETTARLVGLPFEPEDLVGVLAGRAVPPRDLRTATVLPADADGPSLEVVGSVQRERIWMDFASGVVRQEEITGGRLAARVTYERGSDGRLAGFHVTAGNGYLQASVRYRDPVFDAGVEPRLFTFTIPKGAKTRTVR